MLAQEREQTGWEEDISWTPEVSNRSKELLAVCVERQAMVQTIPGCLFQAQSIR